MKFICLCLILWASCAAQSNETNNDYLDPFDGEDQVFLAKALFTKLNTILNVTDKLSQSIVDLNHRQEEHERRVQNTLETLYLDLNKRLEYQENDVKSFHQDLKERLDTQEKLMTTYLNQSQTWHTILRRQNGTVNFERNWNEYKTGFGDSNGEFFIGLEQLHAVTTYGPAQELLVVLKDFENQTRYAKYDLFRIGSEAEKYAILELGAYTGDAGDDLKHHKGKKFTTADQDNDTSDKANCAVVYKSGWWFDNCFYCNLAGPYRNINKSETSGFSWNAWRGVKYSLKFAEMMIRSKL